MTSEKPLIYKGYCTHNYFGEYKIPVPAQNIIYRDYCHKNKFHFKLSTNELFFKNSDVSLQNLLHEAKDLDGILMCSIYMLPTEKKKRDLIFEKIINQKCHLHFVLENIVIVNYQDTKFVNDILQLKNLIKDSPLINLVNDNVFK